MSSLPSRKSLDQSRERARAQPRDTPDPQEKIGPTRLHRPPHPGELAGVLRDVPPRLSSRIKD